MSLRAIPAAALAPAAVIAVDPGGLAPFGPVKWALVPTLVLLAFALTPARQPIERRTAMCWTAFLLVVAMSAVVGLDDLYAWIGTPERHFGALTWGLCALAFVVGHRLDDDARPWVLAGCALTAAVVGLWAVAEAFGWEPFDLVGTGARPIATLGSSAYLGAAAVLLTPVAIAFDRRWWTVAAAALGGVALVVSGARAAWIGALVVVAVLFLLRRPERWRAWLVGGAIAAIAVALFAGVAGRASDAATDRDGGVRGRLDEWRVAVCVIADYPLVGTGPEGYRIAFGSAVDDRYERRHGRNPLPDRAHSSLLDVAATTGMLGLAAFVVLLTLVGRVLLGSVRTAPAPVASVAAGVLGYWLQSLFLFPIAELEPVAWLLAGTVVAATSEGSVIRRRAHRPIRALAAALGLGALAVGVLDVVADRRAHHALQDASPTPSEATAAARLRPDAIRYRLAAARALAAVDSSVSLDRALAELEDARNVSPRDPVAGAQEARLLLERAARAGSPRLAERAVRVHEVLLTHDPRNPALLLGLGVSRSLAGDHRGAIAPLRRAEHLAPRSASASIDLALTYERLHRDAAARAAARRALARDPRATAARRVLERLGDGT